MWDRGENGVLFLERLELVLALWRTENEDDICFLSEETRAEKGFHIVKDQGLFLQLLLLSYMVFVDIIIPHRNCNKKILGIVIGSTGNCYSSKVIEWNVFCSWKQNCWTRFSGDRTTTEFSFLLPFYPTACACVHFVTKCCRSWS